MNFARISGVSSPMKAASSPVSPATGATQLTRILSGASSTAIERDSRFTAPLVALYQASPGRGRLPAVEPVLLIVPPPRRRLTAIAAWVLRKIGLAVLWHPPAAHASGPM